MEDLSKRIAGLSPAKRALLELRLKQKSAGELSAQTIRPRANPRSAAVSFAQQRLWFLDQLEQNRALYNVPRALHLTGAIDVDALQRTLNELARRHEPFRTHFESDNSINGALRQIIGEDAEICLAITDLRNLSADEREAKAKQLAREEAARPFDLAHGPVIRANLLRLTEQEHILLITTHHIVSDAWSAGILFRELEKLYNAFASKQPSLLPPLAIQYADFAEWQRAWLQGEVLDRQLSYWRKQLDGVTGVLDLPTDRPRSALQTSRGAYEFLTIPNELSNALRELSKREGATLFMTLLAAFQTLLWRYTGQDDIVVGSPIAGRNRAEIEDLIGFFINTLALRTNLSGNPTFRELLAQVKETALGAYAHQDLPFEKLVEELQPERDLGRNPLFQVMFQFQNASRSQLNLKDLRVNPLDVSTETAKFDLMLAAREEEDALVCVMEYSTELFYGETIKRMLHQYAILLEGIVARPDECIASLPLMTEVERQQVSVEWNATQGEFPRYQSIHQLFEAQAARAPDEVAVVFGSERVSCAKLNARANQLARYLRRCGVGPEMRVAICVERSVDMIVGLLGILKAGGAYVPLEPNYPAERTSFILADSQARLLLTQKHLRESLPPSEARVVCFAEVGKELARESEENFASGARAENAAHVIYTSGSTGQPKGVVTSHRASVNRFTWMWNQYPFVAGEVCCQKTSLSFVDSIWEIFGPLLRGVPLVIIPDEAVKEPARFVETLEANKVTRLVLVPSLLRAIIESDDNFAHRLDDLQYCICSGETLPLDLAGEFCEKLPRARLINLYGSSEVAADVTCYEVQSTAELSNIPIGRPIANTQIHVLDANFQPTAVGIPGEIFVGGMGLARCYLSRPELSAEKFVPDPFSQDAGARLFRTGDLGRRLPGGNVEYRGRRDYQVKVRGFRIELGEIEVALATHPQVRQAVVITRDDVRGDKQLDAYVVGEAKPPTAAELRAHLRTNLPDYMIPSAFVMLDSLPLTASGKVNRLALPEPVPAEATEDFVAPRTPTEEVLANIWAEVLNLDTIGVNDDFFALGGHSLLLARIVARIQEAFGIELPLRTLFEAPTVSGLAEKIHTARLTVEGVTEPPLVATPPPGPLPLSFAQERLWFFDQLEPGSAAYNIPRALRLRGALDIKALGQSLDEIFARHEVLRSVFLSNNGKPALTFAEPETHEIPLFDLSHLPARERDDKAKELVTKETQRPFGLSRGPLLRLALVRLDQEDHLLVLTMHHIVSDGWSIGIFLRELVSLYNDITAGNDPSLAELPVQYADFAAWQRQCLSGASLEKQLEFWRTQLEDAPTVINLPTDRPRPPVRSFRGARHSLAISNEIAEGLKKIARDQRATLFMALLTAFQLLLSCLSGDEDVVVGSPTAGRNRPETENLIGYFVNTLVLRTKLVGDPDFRAALHDVRETALRAYANQDVPFEKLVDELRPQRSLKLNPLFQVWFVLQNAPVERQEWHGLTAQSVDIDSVTTRHDLQLTLWETGRGPHRSSYGVRANGLEGAFTYSSDLFDAETIGCISEQFTALLAIVSEQPEINLSALRAQLDDVGRAYRRQRAARLEDTSREKLKSVKRRAVGGTLSRIAELETNLNQ